MSTLIAIVLLLLCFVGMTAGLLARKNLKRGCSLGDDCLCKKDPLAPSPEECEHNQNQNS